MATNEQGILGGFSGKVGTVIGGNWNGIDFMRANPVHISNPRTAAQQDQRARMAAIIQFLGPLKAFLRIGFKKQAVKMSAFNAATSYNLAHAITGSYPDFGIDYSKVMLSQGKLPGALNPQISYTPSRQIKFSWEDNSLDNGAMADDRANLLIYCPDKAWAVTSFAEAFRSSGSHTIDLPFDFQGDEVTGYIFFQDVSQRLISDSRLAGWMIL